MKLINTLFLAAALLASSFATALEAPAIPPAQTMDVNGVTLAWTEMGDPDGVPLLMVMGLGAAHQVWGNEFSQGLVDQGFRLIMYDNRDVGGTTRFDEWGEPVLWWNVLKDKLGFEVSYAYTLSDMGDDGIALLDALGIDRAHVMGASMGGMIAQTIAIDHPDRVISLISIMSTTGAPHLPPASDEAVEAIQNTAETPDDELDDIHARGFYPEAIPRQFMAIMQSGDRTEHLKGVETPTLVLHGVDDQLIPLEHGKHTAETIPNARFMSFEGMAHNIPAEVRPQLLQAIEDYALPID